MMNGQGTQSTQEGSSGLFLELMDPAGPADPKHTGAALSQPTNWKPNDGVTEAHWRPHFQSQGVMPGVTSQMAQQQQQQSWAALQQIRGWGPVGSHSMGAAGIHNDHRVNGQDHTAVLPAQRGMLQEQWDAMNRNQSGAAVRPNSQYDRLLRKEELPPMENIAGQMGVGAYTALSSNTARSGGKSESKRPSRSAGVKLSYGDLCARLPQPPSEAGLISEFLRDELRSLLKYNNVSYHKVGPQNLMKSKKEMATDLMELIDGGKLLSEAAAALEHSDEDDHSKKSSKKKRKTKHDDDDDSLMAPPASRQNGAQDGFRGSNRVSPRLGPSGSPLLGPITPRTRAAAEVIMAFGPQPGAQPIKSRG
jgi:hypothetical protein